MGKEEKRGALHCPYCQCSEPKVLGICKVCRSSVCANCGNGQITQKEGKIAIHTHCFARHPEALDTAFRFLKIVK